MRRAALLWRTVFAVVGWSVLLLQFGLMVTQASPLSVLARTINYFSFFTILTNLMVALALTLPLAGSTTRMGRWAASEGVRAMVAMYAVVVGLVYHFLIHPFWHPQGLLLVCDIVLHYVMTTAFLLDWLVFTPKGRLRWIDPVKWLALPILYGVWTVAHGAVTHWWPYGFLDIDRLGWPSAIAYVGLPVFFLLVGLVVVTLDRIFGRAHRRDIAAHAA